MIVDLEFAGRVAGFECDSACFKVGTSLCQLAFFKHGNELRQTGCIGVELQQQFKGATTGQAKAVRFVGADAVLQANWRAVGDGIGFAVLRDQVIFNAAPRHRSHHGAGFGQGHDGTHRPR